MLTSIRIQNFRSIRDASVKLGKVNLFIGPNNSGKSNFLKGIELLVHSILAQPDGRPALLDSFQSLVNRSNERKMHWYEEFIRFQVASSKASPLYIACGYSVRPQIELNDFEPKHLNQHNYQASKPYHLVEEFKQTINLYKSFLSQTSVYKPDPSTFKLISPIDFSKDLSNNGDNIVSFIFNLSQDNRANYQELEKDFASCVGNLVAFSTPLHSADSNTFHLKFFDKDGVSYWGEEVSEGVLYFLALLCIIHQPNPPKLILLEEPEKGIHPRRIREIVGFIFNLAYIRDIQIIITSHSPYVVDHFADIPECISVFDRKNGETVIHNAADIITETNNRLEAAGEEPIHYTDALGEYWVSGFLGGVPETITGI